MVSGPQQRSLKLNHDHQLRDTYCLAQSDSESDPNSWAEESRSTDNLVLQIRSVGGSGREKRKTITDIVFSYSFLFLTG